MEGLRPQLRQPESGARGNPQGLAGSGGCGELAGLLDAFEILGAGRIEAPRTALQNKARLFGLGEAEFPRLAVSNGQPVAGHPTACSGDPDRWSPLTGRE